jgi:hypothetical protein
MVSAQASASDQNGGYQRADAALRRLQNVIGS